MFKRFFSKKIDSEELFAISWKKPNGIEVIIKKADGEYFAKVTSLPGNVVTQAKTGQELLELLNDAVYEYLDIPPKYREALGYFLPPDDVRDELKITIPNKYLNKKIGLVKA